MMMINMCGSQLPEAISLLRKTQEEILLEEDQELLFT